MQLLYCLLFWFVFRSGPFLLLLLFLLRLLFSFALVQYVSIREGVRRRTLELGEDAQAVPITVRQLEVPRFLSAKYDTRTREK